MTEMERGRIPISVLLCNADDSLEEDEDVEDMLEKMASRKQSKGMKRPRWTKWEDELLKQTVQRMGAGSWRKIAEKFRHRSGRQVRLRWKNHLSPEIMKRPWTAAEDEALLVFQRRYGNAWSRIAKSFNGRSDNSVKNRFNQISRMRKAVV